jgi:hypothetical protein
VYESDKFYLFKKGYSGNGMIKMNVMEENSVYF